MPSCCSRRKFIQHGAGLNGITHSWAPSVQRGALRIVAMLFALAAPALAGAAKITLDDGRILEGRLTELSGVAEDPENPSHVGPVAYKPIVVVDDGLRRTYVPQRRVREVNEIAQRQLETIHVPQRVAESGHRIGGVGPIVRITPFDQFGRRIFTMKSNDGPLHIIQGITEVTPAYTKVEGLQGRRPYVWEMRIATGSIPRARLSQILHGVVDQSNPNGRLKIVRLYVQSERYKDARQELEAVIQDFPDLKELDREVRALRQMGSRRLLKEIQMRAEAGQHKYALWLLSGFPSENVAGETLQQVREIQAGYQNDLDRGKRILELMDEYIATIEEQSLKYRLEEVRKEIGEELNYNSLDRMEAFLRLAEDPKLTPRQKLALAVSGWLMGSNNAFDNLSEVLAVYDVRKLVAEYLGNPVKQERHFLFQKLEGMEGARPDLVAKLIAHMKPPLPTDKQDGFEGLYALQVPGLPDELDVTYHLQLPPEYDPLRKYPLIITLNGTGTTPEQQIDWWAGGIPEKGPQRLGQATRHGYIVLAVDWLKPYQRRYEYSAREHHAVLASLRDACRRFSIDTDRVFLSGHSIGGDAVWDIGLAHPDLWAGVIPIVAVSDRFCAHYWENAEYVPFYVVAGELDGDKMHRNARDLDRYLRRGFDCTLVEFHGRGHEHFYDEIQRIFEWMSYRRRDFFPGEFACSTMRTWDNFFWWVEASQFPERSMVNPAAWPPPRGTRATVVSGKVIDDDRLNIKTGADQVSVWLTPDLVDYQKPLRIIVNGRTVPGIAEQAVPNLKVLLEDARGRADRLHPFWSHVQVKGR